MLKPQLVSAITFAFFSAASLAQFDQLKSVPSTPKALCEAGCEKRDGDALFPQGIIDRSCASKCAGNSGVTPPNPGVRPSGNNRAFILLEPMRYVVGNTSVAITVPAGFVTDYASVPEKLWSIYSPHDQYSRAAILHDYLYWTQKCKRSQANRLFLIAMKESNVPEVTRQYIFAGVESGGEAPWEENKAERRKGSPRIVPINRRDFPPNWSWEQYRTKLVTEGYRDPEIVDKGEYCSLGDSELVPGGALEADKVPRPVIVLRSLKGIFNL